MLCLAFNYMHIYAFIVLQMHKNVFKCIFSLHMHTYLHTLYMTIPHIFEHCTHNMHTVA